MNDNNIFENAFNNIDDELIAEAKSPTIRIAARRKKIMISTIAACIAAVLVAIPSIKVIGDLNDNNFTYSEDTEIIYQEEIVSQPQQSSEQTSSKPQQEPENTTSKTDPPPSSINMGSSNSSDGSLDNITIKPKDLYFTNIGANGPTTTYEEVYSPNIEYLYLNQIPTEKYVTIYEGYYEKEINQQEVLSLADKFFPKASKILNISTPGYTTHSYSTSISIYSKFESNDYYGISMHVTNMLNRNIFAFSNFKNPLSINGQIFTINKSQTDTDIINSIKTLKQDLFNLFNVSFNDAKVVRRFDEQNLYNEYTVYLYNSNEHVLNNQLGLSPYTDYISISFDDYDNKSPNTYYLSDIWYWSFRTKDKSHSKAIAKKELLPLEKAEEYLSKGYVLAMGGCPQCQAEQTPVDFTDYDYVSLEYEGGFNVGVLAIPYYAFYKNIGTAENGNMIFAKTYVPAVEVEGYEEYFENKHNNHNNTDNGNIDIDDIIDNPKPPA